MPEQKVKFNIKKVHVVPMITQGETPTYAQPIPIPGAVNFSLSPQGNVTPFFADGITYYQSYANNGYAGDLEVALFPESVLEKIWGMEIGETSKVITENANVESVPFALLFEEDGDTSETKFALYNCTATRPNRKFATNTESKQVQTQTISITAAPLENGKVLAMTGNQTPAIIKSEWYTNVYMENEEGEMIQDGNEN